ncbi:hypothetical protein LSM04_008680 [Trypanosoma melophagium]|uniref:uncharacterized protein n=1 Tax=Trypanosoma melophagium TaxID=715481 RepID=UPI00351A6E5E|nr:hypothetical protein LSM04_008680 [Trypanosoma melophagium]
MSQAGLLDYAFHGNESIYISVASFDGARALEEPNSSTSIDAASRMPFFDSGSVEYNAYNEYIDEFIAASDWWQDPIFISDYIHSGGEGNKCRANNSASGTCGLAEKDTASKEEPNYRHVFYNDNFWRSLECLQDFQQHGIRGKLWTMSESKGKGDRVDGKTLLLRSQILSGYPEESWRKSMEENWWKASEVRADFYANGLLGCMVSAANASVGDYWTNASAGKKWTAANATAFSCSLGDKFKATPEELQRLEEVLQSLFWRASSYKKDFITHGKQGNLWNKSEFNGAGEVISHEEKVVCTSYFLRSSEKYWAGCRYASANWWRTPEVRSDHSTHGFRGSLFGADTAAVAVMGLCRNEQYAVSGEEKEKRSSYFKNPPYLDSRVPQALPSRELKRVTVMGDLFWIHYDSLEDFALHGAQGKVWSAGDAASASTGCAMNFRAKPEEILLRETFLNKFSWKASRYRMDFLQNEFEGELWTKSAPNGGVRVADDEIIRRLSYYASAGMKCEKRFEEFSLFWWKSPDSVAYYMVDGDNSKYIKARSPQVALSGVQNVRGMLASASSMAFRNHYMIMVTPTDTAEEITDTQVMVGITSMNGMWWKNEA